MAIAVDATGAGFAASASSLTFNHDTSGTDVAMVVSMYNWQAVHTITSVVYDGTDSLTQLVSRTADQTGGKLELWGGIITSIGSTKNIVVTASTSGVQFLDASASYTGVDQTTPFPDTETNGTSSASSFSESITTSVEDSWVICGGRSPSKAPTAGTDTTVRKLNPTSGDAGWILDSNSARASGSNAIAWSYSGASTSYWVITAMAPAAAAPTPDKVRTKVTRTLIY